jgi:hypothetical protein
MSRADPGSGRNVTVYRDRRAAERRYIAETDA